MFLYNFFPAFGENSVNIKTSPRPTSFRQPTNYLVCYMTLLTSMSFISHFSVILVPKLHPINPGRTVGLYLWTQTVTLSRIKTARTRHCENWKLVRRMGKWSILKKIVRVSSNCILNNFPPRNKKQRENKVGTWATESINQFHINLFKMAQCPPYYLGIMHSISNR